MTIRKLRVPEPLVAMVRRLHPDLKRKVRASLATLSRDPHAGKALREELEGLRSLRAGRLRTVFRIASDERMVEIVAIGPRRTIYGETYRLIGRDAQG